MLGITNTTTICRRKISLRGAPTSRMGMTTVWRPRVRIDVPNVGDAENTDTSRDELTKKGTKRKRAPKHRRAVRARGEVPLEVQGVRCLSARSSALSVQGVRWGINLRARSCALSDARSAVGHQSASTVVCALSARSAVGQQSASTVVSALSARSAVGHKSASTVVSALGARSAVGHNLRARSSAPYLQGVSERSTRVIQF